jgi:O-antigen ligase
LLIAAAAALYWTITPRRDRAPALPCLTRWLLGLLPLVFAVQVLPLPAGVVSVLSPARAALERAAEPVTGPAAWIPLSAAPAASLELLPVLFACVLAVVLVREIAWRLSLRVWLAAMPLVVIGFLEAVLGLWQARVGGGETPAHGTYVNRNHFAGLLEMCLPFALAAGFEILARHRAWRERAAGPALAACAMFASAAVILAGIVCSFSRMGFVAALFALLLMGIAAVWPARRSKRVAIAALLCALLAAAVFLPADALIARFAELAAAPEISAGGRMRIWRETLPLIRDYPLFGCGLGAYESCFARYKSVAPLATVNYAHNDYLQLLAEGGGAAFAIGIALAIRVLAAARAGACRRPRAAFSYTSLGAAGALGAILLHSLVDFNLYIPANALVLAWIAGLALAPEREPLRPQLAVRV